MSDHISAKSTNMAKANGTWTSNRRGRKRKNPTPDKWPPTAKRHNKWGTPDDDLTEDEYDDVDSDEADYAEETEPSNPSAYRDSSMNVSRAGIKLHAHTELMQNGRPSQLTRSITDPVAKVSHKSKAITFPRLPAIADLAAGNAHAFGRSPVITVEGAAEEHDANGSMNPAKRRKTSIDLPPRPDPSIASAQVPPPQAPAFAPPAVIYDKEEILEFLNKGIEKARQARQYYELDQAAQRRTFEASNSRSNRRLHEAQDKLRWSSYEQAEHTKMREREFQEALKKKTMESIEEKKALRREFEAEQRQRETVQTSNIDSLARQNDNLRRMLDEHRILAGKQRDQMQSMEMEIKVLRRKLGASSPFEVSPKSELEEVRPNLKSFEAQIATKEDTVTAEISHALDEMKSWRSLQQICEKDIRKALHDFQSLSSSITTFNRDLEEMPSKLVVKTLAAIQQQNDSTNASMHEAAQSMDNLSLKSDRLGVGPSPPSPPQTSDIVVNGTRRMSGDDGAVTPPPESVQVNGTEGSP